MPQKIMKIDLSKCVGCGTCAMACKLGNNTPKRQRGQTYNRADFITETKGVFPATMWTALPVLCNHCDKPKCVGVCPVKVTINDATAAKLDSGSVIVKGIVKKRRAMYKLSAAEGGMVLHDDANCIGCGRCQHACPYSTQDVDRAAAQYSVISKNLLGSKGMPFNYMTSTTPAINSCTASEYEVREAVGDTSEDAPAPAYKTKWTHTDPVGVALNDVRPKGVVEKCYLCVHRTAAGKDPYCVEACPAQARTLVDGDTFDWTTAKVLAKKSVTGLKKVVLVNKPTTGVSRPNVAYVGEFSKRS